MIARCRHPRNSSDRAIFLPGTTPRGATTCEGARFIAMRII
jgi:hypothetical protein